MAELTFRQRVKALIAGNEASSVGAVEVPTQTSPSPNRPVDRPAAHVNATGSGLSFRERVRRSVASESQRSKVNQLRRVSRDAATNFPVGSPQAIGAGVPTPVDIQSVQESPSTILDKTSRVQLAKDMQLAGRIGVEVAGGLTGLGAARRIVGPTAGPFLRRNVEALGTGIGEGVGSLVSQSFDPVDEPFKQAAQTAALGGVVDRLAAGLFGAVFRVRKGGTRSALVPGARDTLKELGPGNLPGAAQLSEGGLVDLASNIVDNSLTTAGTLKRRNMRAAQLARKRVGEHVQRFTQTASRQDIDILVNDIVTDRLDTFKGLARSQYAEVDKIADIGVDTQALIRLRNQIVRENQSGAIGSGQKKIVEAIDQTLGVPEVDRGIKRNIELVSHAVDPITKQSVNPNALVEVPFSDMQKLRSDMAGFARDQSDPFASQAAGSAKRTAEVTDQSMEAAGIQLNPDAFEVFRAANQFWKDGAEAFGEQAMRSLSTSRADDMFATIMGGSNQPQQIARFRKLVLGGVGGPEDTARNIRRRAKRILAEPRTPALSKQIAQSQLDHIDKGEDAWNKFVGRFMVNILNAADETAGLATQAGRGDRILVASSALDRLRKVGDETLREIFPKGAQRTRFERLLRIMEITQSGTGSGIGTMGTQMQQAGAVFTLMRGVNAAAMTVLAGPGALARLMDSERFIRFATRAAKEKQGSEAGRRAFVQMMVLAQKEGALVSNGAGEIFNGFDETPTPESAGFQQTVAASRSAQR